MVLQIRVKKGHTRNGFFAVTFVELVIKRMIVEEEEEEGRRIFI